MTDRAWGLRKRLEHDCSQTLMRRFGCKTTRRRKDYGKGQSAAEQSRAEPCRAELSKAGSEEIRFDAMGEIERRLGEKNESTDAGGEGRAARRSPKEWRAAGRAKRSVES